MAAVWGAVASAGIGAVSSFLSGKQSSSAKAASRAQARNLDKQTEILDDQHDFWEDVYKPLESQLGAMAAKAGSEQEQQEAMADAGALTEQAFKGASGDLERQLQQSGANPADPAYQSTLASMAAKKAPAMGGAQYLAAKGVRDDAFNKVAGVAQIGRNIPGQVANGYANAAGSWGQRAAMEGLNARQQTQDIAYALQPVGKAIGNYVSDWWTARNPVSTIPTNTATFNPNQTGVYGDTAKLIGLKTGGIVEEPTVAALAEDGKEEAVLNHGALRLLGKGTVNKLNEMGRMIAQKGMRPPVHSLGAA